MTKIKNPNCEGEHCHTRDGIIKRVPHSSDGNMLLCFGCYKHEMEWRAERNAELKPYDEKWALPEWASLTVYEVKDSHMPSIDYARIPKNGDVEDMGKWWEYIAPDETRYLVTWSSLYSRDAHATLNNLTKQTTKRKGKI